MNNVQKKRQFTSLLLTLAMIVTMIPMSGLTASAESPLPNFKVTEDGVISWEHVKGADKYGLTGLIAYTSLDILEPTEFAGSHNKAEYKKWTETGVTFRLQDYLDKEAMCLPGKYNLTIRAYRNDKSMGYESSFSFTFDSAITQLQAPQSLQWHGTTVTWDSVPNAAEYEIFLYENDSYVFWDAVSGTSYTFDSSYFMNNEAYVYQFFVRAKADGYVDSERSTSEEITGAEILDEYHSSTDKLATHIVISNALNVREGPGTEYARIGGLTKDREVIVVENQGEWSKIVYGTGFGWVQSKYLESIVPVNPFVDIFETAPYYDAVLWAYYADPQITNGMDETHFGPDLTVTRGQAVTFLWRSQGCPEPTSYNNPFKDVSSTEYYYMPILWAVEKGITKGVDDTHFNPMGTLSTQHIITFLFRTTYPGKDGWDGDAAVWAGDEKGRPFGIDIAVNNETDCQRCHVVQFLYCLSK